VTVAVNDRAVECFDVHRGYDGLGFAPGPSSRGGTGYTHRGVRMYMPPHGRRSQDALVRVTREQSASEGMCSLQLTPTFSLYFCPFFISCFASMGGYNLLITCSMCILPKPPCCCSCSGISSLHWEPGEQVYSFHLTWMINHKGMVECNTRQHMAQLTAL
jgi:hypothetical protein